MTQETFGLQARFGEMDAELGAENEVQRVRYRQIVVYDEQVWLIVVAHAWPVPLRLTRS